MMSTEKVLIDNQSTIPYCASNDNSGRLFCSSHNNQTDDTGESEARKLSTAQPKQNGATCSETKCPTPEKRPEYLPSFVKIPFADVELSDCCGEGSFGTVYKGKWLSQGREVAVKTLHRMDEEVRILSTLSHRNIIQFFGACCEVPNCCLVTEYAPYGSLYDFLSSPKSELLEFAQLLTWAKDVALGMNYLHEEAPIQVVHRDLKSKNVLICHDFCLKICDFGASRVFDETTVMTITGTYPWMAPELIQGLPTSEMCDVYSFGVVLWELLTKEVPFKGLQGFQVAWNVVERKERPLIPTTCPKQLATLMQQCWQAEAAERPLFCDILAELNQMLIDEDLGKQADSFVHTKGDWIVEVRDKLQDIRQQESELEEEKKKVEDREEIMKQWAEKLENELKQKSLFNFQFSSSFNCEFSETTKTSTRNVRDTVNEMMFSSGTHQHSREEKIGIRMESSSPSSAGAPLFGVPLRRQGSSSSMGSSRSMSVHSDMTFDMSKVNVDSGPVTFMDSASADMGLPFSKGIDTQLSGRSRLKLQKQMSASSEECQFEGLKMSRESTPSTANGEIQGISAKSKSNLRNEYFSRSSENSSGLVSNFANAASSKPNLPPVDMLEKALRSVNLKMNSPLIAVQLHEKLTALLRDVKTPTSPPLSDDPPWDGGLGSMSPVIGSKRSTPPLVKNAQPSPPVAQKPPLNLSPTRIMDADDIFNTIRQRPKKSLAKSAETQTEKLEMASMATQDANTQTLEMNEKKITHYAHHVPALERERTDAYKSSAREYVTLRLSRNSPIDCVQPDVSENTNAKQKNASTSRQAAGSLSSPLNRPASANGITSRKEISVFSRPPLPKSLSLDRSSSPDDDCIESSRHVAARRVFLSGRASSAMEQRSDVYETDDFTYIIRPNRRRKR